MLDLPTTMALARDITALGVALPPAAQLALDVHNAGFTAANTRPADDLAAGLADGSLTPENVGERLHAAAVTATAKEKSYEILRDLQIPLVRRFVQAVRDDSERLLTDLRKVFAPAATTMHRAGSLFPADATGEQVLSAGPEASAAWRELHQARATLDAIHNVRVPLARHFGYGSETPQVLMFVTGVDTPLAASQAELAWESNPRTVGGRWHALTAAGFTLHLATAHEIAAARAAIDNTERAEQDRLREEHVNQAARRTPRPLFPAVDSPA